MWWIPFFLSFILGIGAIFAADKITSNFGKSAYMWSVILTGIFISLPVVLLGIITTAVMTTPVLEQPIFDRIVVELFWSVL